MIPIPGLTEEQKMPEHRTIALDEGTQNLSNQMAAQANAPTSFYSGMLNQGQDRARTSLGESEDQITQRASRMGMDPNQMKAIRNVYNQQANTGIQQLSNRNEYQAKLMKADYMNTVSKALLGQQQQMVNQYGLLTNAYMQQEAARAGAINSMFQTADTAIGMQMAQNRGQVPQSSPMIAGEVFSKENSYPMAGESYNYGGNTVVG